MSDFTIKTYRDSYLYNTKLHKIDSDKNRNDKTIMDFIMNSTRIDKSSSSFAGIIEDIKRQQTSTVVYDILLMDKVQLCINNYELPRAFKVFDAKDVKGGTGNTVFIDCTGLIEYRNGFYVCKKVDVLVTYLYNALIYILYRYSNHKFMNNSDVILSSTSCYVSLFTFILDYLRIIGYAENKSKISYLIGLFYLHNMMGKELDTYTKNIAARIAGVEMRSIQAYELLIEDGMFDNINTFVESLAKTFRLKGFNLEVFIGKWIYLLGTGTQYASELFSSFGVLLTSAYAGAYIVQQKQIERNCAADLVKFNNAIKTLGVQVFRSSFREAYDVHDKATMEFAEEMKLKETTVAPKCNKDTFKSIEEATNFSVALKDFYKKSHQDKKLPAAVVKVLTTGVSVLESYMENAETSYEEGALCASCKELKRSFKDNDQINKIINLLNDKIMLCQEAVRSEDKSAEDKSRAARCLSELREVKNLV